MTAPLEEGVFEQPPPAGSGSFPDYGVLEEPTITPTPTPLPKDQGILPQGGVLEQFQGADQGLIPLDDPVLVLPPIGEGTTVPQSGQGEKVPLSPGGVAPLPNQGTLPPTDEARQPRFYSPTGGCATYKAQCIPCDPGLDGASCTPETEWPTNSDTTKGTLTPTTPPLFGNDASVLQDGGQDDDDGPVPPECPKTGPIPPDCTMKPKFPDEIAPD